MTFPRRIWLLGLAAAGLGTAPFVCGRLGPGACGGPSAYAIGEAPSDRTRSPRTGWSRRHWEALFGRLVVGHALHLSPGKALTTWGGKPSPYLGSKQGLEGVARILHMVGAWLNDPANPSVVEFGGERIDLVDIARQALANGTDPNGVEYWGAMGHKDQRIVEATDVAWFLWLARERIWPALDAETRARVIDWLAQIDGRRVHDNNWHVFPIVNHSVRKALGARFDPKEIRRHHERLDDFYGGDGWYSDGPEGNRFDYYNPFAIHLGKLLWARMDGASWPVERDRAIRRARAFAWHLPYFFGANGAMPAWGRSLVYRFGVLAQPTYLHWLGASPIRPGLARRMSSGHLAYFLEHGAVSPSGQISQGYWGERRAVAEGYIGPGSPNWAVRGLSALLLPRTDPFWRDVEEPLPVERRGFLHVIPAIGVSLVGTRATGHVEMLSASISHGAGNNYTGKYGKLAYSTHFPPNVLANRHGNWAPDMTLALSSDGERYCHRVDALSGIALHGAVLSSWKCDLGFPAAEILSAVVAQDESSVVIHRVAPTRGVTLRFIGGSHAIDAALTVTRQHSLDDLWSYASGPGGTVFLRSLLGFAVALPPQGFQGDEGTNLAFQRSIVGMVEGRRSDDREFTVASMAVASPTRLSVGSATAALRHFTIDDPADAFRWQWADGEDAWISLAAAHPERSVSVGGLTFEGPLVLARAYPDGRRFAGGGVRRVRGAGGNLLFESLAEPATVLWEKGEGMRVETDRPCRFAAGHGEASAPDLSGPDRWRPLALARDGDLRTLNIEDFRRAATNQELTLALIRVQ